MSPFVKVSMKLWNGRVEIVNVLPAARYCKSAAVGEPMLMWPEVRPETPSNHACTALSDLLHTRKQEQILDEYLRVKGVPEIRPASRARKIV